MKNRSRNTLNKAYENLFNRIHDLEDVTLEKIRELSVVSDFFDSKSSDLSQLKNKILTKSKEIEDLENELYQAREKISELKRENEFLNEKNSLHIDKIFKFKTQGSKLIESIEGQVEQVKNSIKTKLK